MPGYRPVSRNTRSSRLSVGPCEFTAFRSGLRPSLQAVNSLQTYPQKINYTLHLTKPLGIHAAHGAAYHPAHRDDSWTWATALLCAVFQRHSLAVSIFAYTYFYGMPSMPTDFFRISMTSFFSSSFLRRARFSASNSRRCLVSRS